MAKPHTTKTFPHLPFPLNNPPDECVNGNLSFDEIAEVAVYLYTDLMHEPKAKVALRKVVQKCSPFMSSLPGTPLDKMEAEVGWDGLYNRRVEEVLSEYPFKTSVDEWGARCWTDLEGERHCGDDSGFYPWYTDERLLRKTLDEYAPKQKK